MTDSPDRPIFIATRGSALALAQANMVLAQCRSSFPGLRFEIKIIKTTGDKLQTASMARIDANLPRGLFTKELEVALLNGEADLAVHSLKDLPTDLPEGLVLGATPQRADVRDVLIYKPGKTLLTGVASLPQGVTIATSSTRRKAQLLAARPDLNIVEIRGNVTTRMEKLVRQPELTAIVLAAAGLHRLNFTISADGELKGEAVPPGLRAIYLAVEEMLPCVGQAAIGIEIRAQDERIEVICRALNHVETLRCVTAERAFLHAMGGGCQTPVGALALQEGQSLRMRVISFMKAEVQRARAERAANDAAALGQQLAEELKRSA